MKYRTAPGIILTGVCGSYYLVSSRETVGINETAAFYRKKLEQGSSEAELAAYANENYEIEDPEILRTDIRDFVESLMEKHFLVRYGA